MESFMAKALVEAEAAYSRGEVPVGAVIVHKATASIVAASGNRCEEWGDPTAHAEILAIREACKTLRMARLTGCDIYVTLEPCPMCAQAISFARFDRLYFGAYDSKGGGVDHGPHIFHSSSCHHRPDYYGGIAESQAAALLRRFFQEKR